MRKEGFRAEPVEPPAFRTTAPHRYKVVGVDGERVEEGPRETPLDRPGIRIEASDRVYVVEPTGALRRVGAARVRRRSLPLKSKIVSASRIEAAIEQAERRRLHRKLKKAQGRHERVEKALAGADAALARARGEG